jgi:hypothetical protein
VVAFIGRGGLGGASAATALQLRWRGRVESESAKQYARELGIAERPQLRWLRRRQGGWSSQ